ncbi:arylsulfatase [Verrucomicrobiaceae bacterium N1E253]|uniref:Arylsulfatase n=1 Tax=Oceaniferula marina TaxID=2748318 RepID=A0A851GLA8_9BACT|nr:arylsulfatase [Oceaniferula marina]NWK55867.1 arylsulfatase [Oceaniferula marina]
MKRTHLRSLCLLAALTLSPLQADERPNIVFILADDLGTGDLGCYNKDSKIPTPRLDQLADEGMRFTDAHSNSSVCTPTRYGVLTGRYCWRSRLKRGVLMGYSPALIEEGRETVASLLKKQGYTTACIGKWHLGMNMARSVNNGKKGWDYQAPIHRGPNAVGFDYFLGIAASLDMPPYTLIENDRFVSAASESTKASSYPNYWRGGAIAKDFKHEDYLPLVGKQASAFISKQSADKPFFLYLPLPAPHKPVVPTKAFQGKTKATEYGDFVHQMDHVIGQVVDALKSKKLFANTLLIVTSDNASFAANEKYGVLQTGHSPNHIYRGQKTDIYEGGHRVPWIATWPAKVKAGSTTDQVVCTTDLLATCAEITSSSVAENAGEDSYSLLPILIGKQGKEPLREATIHHSSSGMFAIRKGKWKLIVGRGSGGRTQIDKAIKDKIQLYDMEKDIRETSNVYQDFPEVVKELSSLLDDYRTSGRSVPQ